MTRARALGGVLLRLMVGGAMLGAGAGFFLLAPVGKTRETQAVEEAPRRVQTIVLARTAPETSRVYPARVQADRTAVLSFRVGGPLVAFPAKAGAEVEKDDCLAKIDSRDYQRRLAQVDASLDQARAKLAAMRAGARPEEIRVMEERLRAAEARATQARAEYERLKGLHDERVTTASDLDAIRSAYVAASAEVEVARQSLEMGRKGARAEDIQAMEAQIRLLEAQRLQADDALGDTDLVAPFAGSVAKTFVENHTSVAPGQPILLLHDVGHLELVIDVPAREVVSGMLLASSTVSARFPALPGRSFPLEPKEMETVADPVTHTYPVTYRMEVPEGVLLLPGMSGEVVLEAAGSSRPRGFWVPTRALVQEEGAGAFVWRYDPAGRTVHKAPVEPGAISGGRVEIVGAVEEGDRVVVAGAPFLVEGMRVEADG